MSEFPTVGYRWRDKAGVNQASINDPEENWCDSYGDKHGKHELVRREDAEQHAELVLRELIVWLNDSLNGIDGEIAEPDASEVDVPDDIMEQLRWKTQNMREEVESVGKNLLEQYFDLDKTLKQGDSGE